MGERYWITGAQLGVLVATREPAARRKQVEQIIDEQFIANCESKAELKIFDKKMKETMEFISIESESREPENRAKHIEPKCQKCGYDRFEAAHQNQLLADYHKFEGERK